MINAFKDYLRIFGAKAALLSLAMAAASMANSDLLMQPSKPDQWRDLARKLRALADELSEGL